MDETEDTTAACFTGLLAGWLQTNCLSKVTLGLHNFHHCDKKVENILCTSVIMLTYLLTHVKLKHGIVLFI